jgi:hypothetical protein
MKTGPTTSQIPPQFTASSPFKRSILKAAEATVNHVAMICDIAAAVFLAITASQGYVSWRDKSFATDKTTLLVFGGGTAALFVSGRVLAHLGQLLRDSIGST